MAGKASFSVHSSAYWSKLVEEIEAAAIDSSDNEDIRKFDFSVTLPENLRQRVSQIVPYEFDEFDKNAYIEDLEMDLTRIKEGEIDDAEEEEIIRERERRKLPYNESTCSEIERLENEFPAFDVKIDIPFQRMISKAGRRVNWFTKYICKSRHDRVIWHSKIYQLERSIWEKNLDEQSEQLMDASAERFAEWLNSLGSHHDNDLTKEKIKALFSIEGDNRLFASIHIEPKEVKAIAKTIADKWNLPEMAIELKYENYVQNRWNSVSKDLRSVAFGRTIPYKDRPWIPSERDKPIATIFPEELLSAEKLFKGIMHLRSTKLLVDFCRRHSNIEKPRYLVRHGAFKERVETTTKQEIPLYERLKIFY